MKLTQNQYNIILYTILFFITIALVFVSNTLSISYKESLNVFENNSLLTLITNTSLFLFGQNDFALRFPFIIFYILSVILIHENTKNYFKHESDRFTSTLIFMFLPGVLSASLLVNSAIIVTFLTLLYIYLYQKTKEHNYMLLLIFLFVDNSFSIFFLALFLYSLSKKSQDKILYLTAVLFILSMLIYGFDSTGKPKGFLVDTFAIYASIFSPLLFLYFFYSIYRVGIKFERSLVWYISTTALIFSIVFSFRQHIYIEDYAPYVIISVPLMVKLFFHTLRIRLNQFRKRHHFFSILVLIMLTLNVLLTLYNKPIYLFLDNPKKHFAYKYHIAKELAAFLKSNNIDEVYSDDKKMIQRLKFYNIKKGDKYFISLHEFENYNTHVGIKYHGKIVADIYIRKKL